MSSSPSKLSRRTLFVGAGAVGALAATVSVLPAAQQAAVTPVPKAKPERGGGYELSAHVKQYYKTTLV
jgi:hypothetical protein